MTPTNRREFLRDVSCGMLVAGLGTSLAADLGFSTAFAAEGSEDISLGEYGPLVDLLETNVDRAEKLFATVGNSPRDAMNALQPAIQDDINVHRFVFAHRTYGLVGLLGKEYSHTLLRQCVRFCIDHEQGRIAHKHPES